MIKLTIGICLQMVLFTCTTHKENILSFDFFEVDTVSIRVTDSIMSRYYTMWVSQQNNEDHLVAYNDPRHQIDLFHLDEQEHYLSISLQNSGPNHLANPGKILYHDSLVFSLNAQFISIFDRKGVVEVRLTKENLLREKSADLTFGFEKITYSNFATPSFNPDQRKVYLPIFSYASIGLEPSYQEPFVSEVDLTAEKVELLEQIEYPLSIKENYYHALEYPYFSFFDPYLIISFQYTPETIFYNTETRQVKKHMLEGSSVNELAEPILVGESMDTKRIIKYLHSSIKYYAPSYNSELDLFGRVIKGKTDSEDGFFASDNNYFCLYRSNGQLLGEWHLPPDFYPLLLTGRKHYYFLLTPTDDSQLRFARLRPKDF